MINLHALSIPEIRWAFAGSIPTATLVEAVSMGMCGMVVEAINDVASTATCSWAGFTGLIRRLIFCDVF